MMRKVFVVLFAMTVLGWVAPLHAQMKDSPKQAPKTAALKMVDINTASQTEIAGVGLENSVAKKIIDGRPFRSKRELVTRNVVTPDQYEKIKNLIVAKRPANRPKK